MFEAEVMSTRSLPQLISTAGLLQYDDRCDNYMNNQMFMEDCFITDLEEFLNNTDIPKEVNTQELMKNTPTPSPTTAEVPDLLYYSPTHSLEEYNMASPPYFKESGVPSPQVMIKEEFPLNSPPSLYHDKNLGSPMEMVVKKDGAKPKSKYGHLVSLLSAPPMPMTNTINDTIISQLGHANTDNSRSVNNSPTSYGNVTIKKELPDASFLDTKQEQENKSYQQSQMASNDCNFSTDIGSLAMEHVYKDIQATCTSLGISRDPTKWTSEDVKCWLIRTVQELKLPSISIEFFQMDGISFCGLSESDFCQRAPQCGEALYAQLYIWKTAVSSNTIGSNFNRFSSDQCSSSFDSFVPWAASLNSPGSPDSMASIDSSNTFTSISTDNFCPSVPSCSSSSFHGENPISDDDITSDDGDNMEATPSEVIAEPGQKSTTSHSHIHLWQFLKELLSKPHLYGSCIRWMDRTKGIFKIEDSVRVARLWGKRKNRPAMNYDKLSRSIRQYYKKGIMKKTERSQRLVYQFCSPYCL